MICFQFSRISCRQDLKAVKTQLAANVLLPKMEAVESREEKLWDWPLQGHDGVVKVHEDDDHFEVGLDATYFSGKDISVKVVNDLIEIHFEHEARGDTFGHVSRSITRCYKLPKGVDPKSIKSQLSHSVLVITGQKTH